MTPSRNQMSHSNKDAAAALWNCQFPQSAAVFSAVLFQSLISAVCPPPLPRPCFSGVGCCVTALRTAHQRHQSGCFCHWAQSRQQSRIDLPVSPLSAAFITISGDLMVFLLFFLLVCLSPFPALSPLNYTTVHLCLNISGVLDCLLFHG